VSYLDAWADSQVPILRRLAIHGWTRRDDVDATQKLAWLRDRKWLSDHQPHHEVYRLIAVALPQAVPSEVDGLVADVVAGFGDSEDEEHRAYERFNSLSWITEHAPNVRSAREALDQVTAEHPEFKRRPYPDLRSWMESGSVGPQPPMTTSELHAKITADAARAIVELRGYEASTRLSTDRGGTTLSMSWPRRSGSTQLTASRCSKPTEATRRTSGRR
jgi:hypothetical protein